MKSRGWSEVGGMEKACPVDPTNAYSRVRTLGGLVLGKRGGLLN